MRLDEKEKAKRYAYILLNSLSSNENLLTTVWLYITLAYYFLSINKFAKSKEYALAVKKAIEDKGITKILLPESYYILALAEYHAKEYLTSLHYLDRTIELFRNSQGMYGLSKALLLKAEIYYSQDKYDVAKKILQEALIINKENEYTYHTAKAQSLLASVYLELGKITLSYESIIEALHIAIAKSYYDIATVCYKILSYFFKYPLSDIIKKRIDDDYKIKTMKDLKVLYEKYFDRTTNRQKYFLSLIKEPKAQSDNYNYHVVTNTHETNLNYGEYKEFLNNAFINYTLIVNLEEDFIWTSTYEKLDVDRNHLIFKLLVYFIRKRDTVLSKEELIESVWHERYDPSMHDQLIYTTIKKLRDNIEDCKGKDFTVIINVDNGYYFNVKFPFCFIEKRLVIARPNLNDRQTWILHFLYENRKITNKDFVNYFRSNRTTAYLVLDNLVSKNLLIKKGKGRSRHYCLKEESHYEKSH